MPPRLKATTRHCLGTPAASVVPTRRPYDDHTATISVSVVNNDFWVRWFANDSHKWRSHSDPTAMLPAPWATLLRCHGALPAPAAAPQHANCKAKETCFPGLFWAIYLPATSASLGIWLRSAALPRRSMRPHSDPTIIIYSKKKVTVFLHNCHVQVVAVALAKPYDWLIDWVKGSFFRYCSKVGT